MPQRFVYAVVYCDDPSTGARLVIFTKKRMKSYFYHDPLRGGGKIYPHGRDINYNPGEIVLAGGGWKGQESEAEGALREFREETAYDLENPQRYSPPIQTQQWTDGSMTYAAGYIKIDTRQNITAVRAGIAASMNEAGTAVTLIRTGVYKEGDYTQMRTDLPIIPVDNEMETVELWDINDQAVWATIQGWQNGNRNWFYNILYYLKYNIPAVPPPPPIAQPPRPASRVF